MKNTKITVITNLLLVFIVFSVLAVGIYSERSVTISSSSGNGVIYRGTQSSNGVALMFNVYENTSVVQDIISVLKSHGVTATFFVGGCWADDNDKTLKDIVNSGFEIGNHGYFHKDHKKLSYEKNREEILNCHSVVLRSTGYNMKLFAPPSGAYSKTTVEVATELNYKTIMWSKDTIDWRDSDIQTILKRATKGVSSGDLILMHPKPHTLEALPLIIQKIKEQNLKFLTVSECASLTPIKV
ncbi:MAG: polysaccharide deacetylase family protein [Clostridia bacterium]|nr:polysaccharide deacetylase family protein [Clostridia bacterium]